MSGPTGPGDRKITRRLPPDWSTLARGPARFELPRPGWRELMLRYASMKPATPLYEIFKVTVGRENPTHALLESDYVDEDFRDEYINFYAKTHRDLPRRCERLHFFDDRPGHREDYLGYTVLRPIIGRPVCRTMLRPPAGLTRHVSCTARYSTTPWGYRKHVDGFPFMSQDAQLGSCTHAAIWMMALYFHLKFRRPRYHVSDIVRSARDHHDFHPAVPTQGLTPRQASAVLHDLDMSPVIYTVANLRDTSDTPEAIACRYLSSGLPVMLLIEDGARRHAVVLIGYGRDDEGLFFVHHDDQKGPYLVTRNLPDDESGWHSLMVPMPGKIYVSGEVALEVGGSTMRETIDSYERLESLRGGLDDGRQRLQPYLTEVSDYKRDLRRRQVHEDVVTWHTGWGTPHWLWVIELQDRAAARTGESCVLGEIVLDATSDDQWTNKLFCNLPGLTMHWPSLGDDIVEAPSGQSEAPYLTGCPLHVPD